MKEAEERLSKSGYYVSHQFNGYGASLGPDYEISNSDGEVVMDHLSEAQVIQLSSII